jgi:hypothetical protein
VETPWNTQDFDQSQVVGSQISEPITFTGSAESMTSCLTQLKAWADKLPRNERLGKTFGKGVNMRRSNIRFNLGRIWRSPLQWCFMSANFLLLRKWLWMVGDSGSCNYRLQNSHAEISLDQVTWSCVGTCRHLLATFPSLQIENMRKHEKTCK